MFTFAIRTPMTSAWTEQEGTRLKQMREQALIDEVSFAIDNSISLVQLQQLEKGGQSSFYTPTIKAQLGRKLLNKLQALNGDSSG
jgi:hypothetical protein